jgi:2-oxoglutarate dehydrogenase E1 component
MLLRYPKAVSTIEELAEGRFHEVIDDESVEANNVDTVALCSGKVYYDILEEQEKIGGTENLAVVRLEQLFPVPAKQLDALKERYPNAKKWIWVQEEPENMGAWSHMLRCWRSVELDVIARPASGSPASGSPKVHQIRHQAILDELFSHALVTSK